MDGLGTEEVVFIVVADKYIIIIHILEDLESMVNDVLYKS